MSKRKRSRWGWGFEDAAIGAAEVEAAAPGIEPLFGFAPQAPETAVPFERVELPAPAIEPPPGALSALQASLTRLKPPKGPTAVSLGAMIAVRWWTPKPA